MDHTDNGQSEDHTKKREDEDNEHGQSEDHTKKTEDEESNYTECHPLLTPVLIKKKTIKCGRLVGFAIAGCLVLLTVIAVAISLYGFAFAGTSPLSGSTLAEQGDYVLLNYHTSKYGLVIYDYIVQFTVLPDTIDSVNIYTVSCNSLLDETNRTHPFMTSNSIAKEKKFYFSNCSSRICVLDQFVYQAMSSVSSIVYNITLERFTSGETEVIVVAYDNFQYFQEFLSGTKPSEPIKVFRAKNSSFTFALGSAEMKQSSYYFFAIKSIKGSSEWFTVGRTGLHVYYNASSLSPHCVLNNSCNCSCEIKLSDSKQCFLGCVQNSINDHNDSVQLYFIHHEVIEPTLGYLIIPIIFLSFSLIMVTFIGCSLGTLLWRKKSVSTSSLPKRHSQNTLASDPLTVNRQTLLSCQKASDFEPLTFESEEQISSQGMWKDGSSPCSYNSIAVPSHQHKSSPILSKERTAQVYCTHDLTEENCSKQWSSPNQTSLVDPIHTSLNETNTSVAKTVQPLSPLDEGACSTSAKDEEIMTNTSKPSPSKAESQCEIEVEEVIFDESGLFYHCESHGATIIIPEGAVQGPATLQFGASLLLTDFKSETGTFQPVFSFIWVHTDSVLSKPAELYIPHYAVADTVEEKGKLFVLTRGHEEKSSFKVNNQSDVTISETMAHVRTTHFYTLCVAATIQKRNPPKLRYHMVYSQNVATDGSVDVDICILYCLKCLKNLRKYYNKKCFEVSDVVQLDHGFMDDSLELCNDLSDDADWQISARGNKREKILAEEIDMHRFLDCIPETYFSQSFQGLIIKDKSGATQSSVFVIPTSINSPVITFDENEHPNTERIWFDEKGLYYHCNSYGVTIIIPEGAVQGPATLQYKASLLPTQFKCEGTYQPVSPSIWIHFDRELKKPAELCIPHYVVADTDEEKKQIFLLTRGHDENAVFSVNNKSVVEISETMARVRATHFCSLCLAAVKKAKEKELRKKYHTIYATKTSERVGVYVDICVLYSFRCLKSITEYYENKGYEVFRARPLGGVMTEEGIKCSVNLSEDTDWKFPPNGADETKITPDDVDIFKVLGCDKNTITDDDEENLDTLEKNGSYPPRFTYLFQPKHEQCSSHQVNITLHGSSENRLTHTILLNMKESFQSVSLESSTSSVSGSKFCDAIPFLESMLKSRSNFSNFICSLGLNDDETIQSFTRDGHNMKHFLQGAITKWEKASPNPSFMDIARALIYTRMAIESVEQDSVPEECHQLHTILSTLPASSKLSSEPAFDDLDSYVAAKLPNKWELF